MNGAAARISSKEIAIVGGSLVEGLSAAPVENSLIIITGDSLTVVDKTGKVPIPKGAQVIDANGLLIAPGFIDTHNHSDRGLSDDPLATSQVSQGITTVVVGQDGDSALPIAKYLATLDQNPVAVNVATLLGHATLRDRVMGGDTARQCTTIEIEQMTRMVEQAMKEGAFGLSSGLEYKAGKDAPTSEVAALALMAGQYKGLYFTHIRDEGDNFFESLHEAIQIGKSGLLPVQVSHIKLGSASVWGRARQAIEMIETAHRFGYDITADCYPYDQWNSSIEILVPSGRYGDQAEVAAGFASVGGPGEITIVRCPSNPDYEFRTMKDIAYRLNVAPIQLFTNIIRDGGASVICRAMREQDIQAFYQQPWVMVSSDGGIGSRHPRGAGTFPRVLGRFVRELNWLSLTEAIRKMTSMPALRLRLPDRGLVRRGYKADLVLFDPNRVIDRATFERPQLTSEGVIHVFVNGVEVWREGVPTGHRPGRALRHTR